MGEIIGNGYYSPGYATPDPIESECLEVYELNLEKNKGKVSLWFDSSLFNLSGWTG